ncbi:hypothetical protein EON65_20050 [archaeon]|nr:MAG: hypothetical protein EON65_20050 [archaeon]
MSIIVFIPLILSLLACARGDYVAAVAEHTVFMGQSSDTSSYKLQVNLDIYKNLTVLAKSRGAQVLVFPEFGLVPDTIDHRSSLYDYAEEIDFNPSNPIVPCDHPEQFTDKPVQYQMSCVAKEQGIVVLVNTVHWVDCDSAIDSSCPEDKHYQFNTDIILDERGALVSLYHKSHEFPGLLKAYDQYPQITEVTYKASFGVTFGIFICFDIMFDDPPKMLRQQGVEHFLYAVQQGDIGEKTIIEGWSKSNDAVVLSANLGSGKNDCSGIINRGTPLNAKKYFLTDSAFSEENVLVATVPAN